MNDTTYGKLLNELMYEIAGAVRGRCRYTLLELFRKMAVSESYPVRHRLLVKKYGKEKAEEILKEEEELVEEAVRLLKKRKLKIGRD